MREKEEEDGGDDDAPDNEDLIENDEDDEEECEVKRNIFKMLFVLRSESGADDVVRRDFGSFCCCFCFGCF